MKKLLIILSVMAYFISNLLMNYPIKYEAKEINDINNQAICNHELQNYPAVSSSCCTQGNTEYWYCETCEKYYSDALAENEISQEETLLPLSEHSFVPTFDIELGDVVDVKNVPEAILEVLGYEEKYNYSFKMKNEELSCENEECQEKYQTDVYYYEYEYVLCLEGYLGNGNGYVMLDSEGKVVCNSLTSALDTFTNGHELKHYDAVEGSCIQDGNLEYWHCERCNKYFLDEICENEATFDEINYGKIAHVYKEDFDFKNAVSVDIEEIPEEILKMLGYGTIDIDYVFTKIHVEIECSVEGCNHKCETDVYNYYCTYYECILGYVMATNGYAYVDDEKSANLKALSGSEDHFTPGHLVAHVDSKNITTTLDGNIEYWYCERCGRYYSDEKCLYKINYEDTIIDHSSAMLIGIAIKKVPFKQTYVIDTDDFNPEGGQVELEYDGNKKVVIDMKETEVDGFDNSSVGEIELTVNYQDKSTKFSVRIREKYIIGDMNDDEKITDADAVYLLMNIYFPLDYPTNQPCDFNKDGKTTDADAVYLLMHIYFPLDYPIDE